MSASPSTIERSAPGRTGRAGLALVALAAAQFLVTLDASIVNIALPRISHGLDLSPTGAGWVVNSYLVVFAGLMLLGGRLADVLRPRTVFIAGLTVFTVASLLAGLAPNGAALVAARVLQGAGGAAMAPAALSLLVRMNPEGPARARVFGVWGGVSGAGGIAGVLAGGWLSDAFGWPSIFLVNVPMGVLVLMGVLASVPVFPGGHAAVDLAGAVSVTLTMAALCLGVVNGSAYGWAAPATWLPLVVSGMALAAFLIAERRSRTPLVPLWIFRHEPLMLANLMMLVVGAVMVALFFFLPQYQQGALGMSSTVTGTSQLPIALAITAGSALTSRLAGVVGGSERLLVGAAAMLTAGLLWLVTGGADATYLLDLLGPFVLIGFSLGIAFVLVTARAMAAAGPDDSGLASGLVNTARQTGGAIGLAALLAIAAGNGEFDTTAAFLGTVALAALLLVLSLVPHKHQAHL